MFITAVCVIFLIKLRWPKNKSLYDNAYAFFLGGGRGGRSVLWDLRK